MKRELSVFVHREIPVLSGSLLPVFLCMAADLCSKIV